jgi:hypothetical protein
MTSARLLRWHADQAKMTSADRYLHLAAAAFLRGMARAEPDHRKNIAAGLAKAKRGRHTAGQDTGVCEDRKPR